MELESSPALGTAGNWQRYLGSVTSANGLRVARLRADPGEQFFRLRALSGPLLQIEWRGNGVLISWVNAGARYVLETTDQVPPATWQRVSQTPALANNRYSLQMAAQSRTQFFRLRQDDLVRSVTLTLRLTTDTGISASDRLTSTLEIEGSVAPRTNVVKLRASLDALVPAQFREITDTVDAVGNFSLSAARLEQINGAALADGPHRLFVVGEDASSRTVGETNLDFVLDRTGPRASLSPADGQRDVLPAQLVIATFTEPVLFGGTGTVAPAGTLTVSGLGTAVVGRLVTDHTGLRLSFVPTQELPGNAAFDVALVGTNLVDRAGNPAAIATLRTHFRTANGEGVPGTELTGWVFDSSRSAQGNETPLVGAHVTALNGAGVEATTDAGGKFTLQNVPGGRLLIEVDGRTVQTLAGTFYPTVTKLFEATPGVGTIIDAPIYLPLVRDSAFVQLATNAPTVVVNSEQLPGWTLDVPPNTVQRRDGSLAGRILISPVPPNRLPAPLPPGVDPSVVITIQTEGGADVFTQPVPLTAPNLEGLPPGAKTVLWDFDHARGAFVPVATATVSDDGKTITTDPGQGVLRPGWHFIRNFFDDLTQVLTTENPKKNNPKAMEEYKRRRLAVQLDLAALTADAAGLYPPAGLIAAGAGAAAGALRDVVVDGNGLNSAGRDGVLLGIQAGGDRAGSNAAETAYRASRNVASRELQNATQDLKLLSKTLKGTAGIFTIVSALDDINTLQEDLAAAKKALKDPPGDLSDQIIRSATDLEDAANDLVNSLTRGLAEYLNGIGDALSMVDIYELGPPAAPPSSPDLVRLRALSLTGQAHFLEASSVFTRVPDQLDAFLARASNLQPLLARETDDRILYRFAPGAVGRAAPVAGAAEAAAVVGSTFNEIRLSLRPGQSGLLTAVEPVAGLVASRTVGIPATIPSGQVEFREPPLLLEPSEALDLDGNGLADDIDVVLDHPTRAQVAALRNGLSPEQAGLAPLGIIGRLAQGREVAPGLFAGNAYADLIPGDRVLYGIGGSNVLEVIDISRPGAPVKMGALRSIGSFSALRGFARGQRLAVTGFGARVFDMSDPRDPRQTFALDYTVAGTDRVNPILGANHLVVAKGKELLSFDLDTGEQVSSVSLAALGGPIKLELNGDVIYVLTYEPLPNLQFSVTTVRFDGDGKLQFLGEVRPFFWSTFSLATPYGLAVDDRAAFVGPWLISADPFIPGFGTIDISDPTKPAVIASPSTNTITGGAILATDNAGHLLATVAGTAQNKVLDVYDVSDLTRTDRRIYSIPLNSPPYAPAFTGGLAVFATQGDTYIARVVPIDGGGVPPTIHQVILQTGPTAMEGRRVGVHVQVTDDAQVARVELLLQGDNVVASDATYPFDLDFLPPASLPDGQPLTLTIRATDSGGSPSERSANLTYHARPPRIVNVIPPLGFTTKLPLTNGAISFDKPLDRGAVTKASFDLRAVGSDGKFDTADDLLVPIGRAEFSSDSRRIALDFGPPLPVGRYRLTALSTKIMDAGGNLLDGEFTGAVPSGDGRAGGDFVTMFDVLHVPELALDAMPLRGIVTDPRDYRSFDVQSGTSPILGVDVNGDGRLDFVRTLFSTGGDTNDYHSVLVTLQNADGTFATPVAFPTERVPVQVAAGDVSGDGVDDLVTLHFDVQAIGFPQRPQPYHLNVLLGTGNGTFGPPRLLEGNGLTNLNAGLLFVGDFTGGGRADVVRFLPDANEFSGGRSTNVQSATVVVYPSLGDGNFGPPVTTELTPTRRDFTIFRSVAVPADFNRDGKLDLLVVGEFAGADAQVLLSNGDGSFTRRIEPKFNDGNNRLAAADFTGDGLIDVIYGNQWYRGQSDGSFELVAHSGLSENGVQRFNASGGPELVGDFDRDGRADFAAELPGGDFSYSQLGIFTNKSDGTLALARTVLVGSQFLRLGFRAGDIDGNGWTDLFTSAGEGSDSPYQAVILVADGQGGFPNVPVAKGLGDLVFNEMPLLSDLNGDGTTDVVSSYLNPNPGKALGVVLARPGGFEPVIINQLGLQDPDFFIRALRSEDFDGDGKEDVVLSQFADAFSTGASNIVYLMRGHGDGTLDPGQLIPDARSLIATGDFTGDGKPDLLTVQSEAGFGSVLAMLPGHGDGTFGAALVTRDRAFSFGAPFLLGDFNGDGKLDLLARGGSGLGIWINDGTGRFSLGGNVTSAPGQWEVQALGDFNRDGKLDVVINDRRGDIKDYKWIVLPGDGTGQLGAPLAPTPFPGTYNGKAAMLDLNADGAPDLITSGRSPNQLMEARVSLGNGDGTFQPPVSFFGVNTELTTSVLPADFNGDGLMDLLVGQSLLLQRRPNTP